ncbi:MAG: thrombospondin type 3 repeat-containing protein, partial [Polyangiales bacterium]
MRPARSRKPLFAAVLGFLSIAAIGVTREASAQSQGFHLNRFDPAPAGDLFFGVQRPTVEGDFRVNAALIGDYAHAPLVLRDTRSGDTEVGRVVSRQAYLHVAASVALFDRLLLSVNIPIAVINQGDSPRTAGGTQLLSPDSVAAGDVRFGARVRLVGENDTAFQLSLGTYLYAPSGDQDAYTGEGKARVAPSLILGGVIEDFLAWNANAGMMFRRGSDLLGAKVGSEFLFGAGLGVMALNKTFIIGPELYGSTEVVDGAEPFTNASTNMELLGSIRYRPSPFVIGFGAGPGFGAGLGTPDFRMVATVGYAPWSSDTKPEAPKDGDGDGIYDRDDACPTVPGVASADPTKNGCPAEKLDTDKDGITDDVDACKDVPGVKSDDPKKNGCPPDRDGDTILDPNDACPDVPGRSDPDPKKNGCPLVQLTAGAIVITEQ